MTRSLPVSIFEIMLYSNKYDTHKSALKLPKQNTCWKLYVMTVNAAIKSLPLLLFPPLRTNDDRVYKNDVMKLNYIMLIFFTELQPYKVFFIIMAVVKCKLYIIRRVICYNPPTEYFWWYTTRNCITFAQLQVYY